MTEKYVALPSDCAVCPLTVLLPSDCACAALPYVKAFPDLLIAIKQSPVKKKAKRADERPNCDPAKLSCVLEVRIDDSQGDARWGIYCRCCRSFAVKGTQTQKCKDLLSKHVVTGTIHFVCVNIPHD